MKARKVLVIGVPWSGAELAMATSDARDLNASLVVADTVEGLGGLDPGASCDRLEVAKLDVQSIVDAMGDDVFDAVVSITELTVELAAAVREASGLVGTSVATERAVLDKAATRETLRTAGLTGVDFRTATIADLPDLFDTMDPPVIVKPRSFTGSIGVRLLRDQSDVDAVTLQYDPLKAPAFDRDQIVVESFVAGPEISAEGLVVDGKFSLFALTDKFNTGAPIFYEIAHVMPSRYTTTWSERAQRYLQDVVEALGVVTSPVHAELKLVGENLELVEIHTRYGGGRIVDLLQSAYPYRPYRDYLAAVLDGTHPAVTEPSGVWGTGFLVGLVDRPLDPFSFALPHPETVVAIDFDARRRPRVVEHEGLRLQYWRAGHVTFSSAAHSSVQENAQFITDQFQLTDPAAQSHELA